MNKKYVIAIEETLVQEFDIEANNAEEAFRKAVEHYENGDFCITQGEVQFKHMAIISPYMEATDGAVKSYAQIRLQALAE